jgi:hypothetical protein
MASLRTHFVTNYKDWQGVAYIQWATADITQKQGAESVIYVTDTAVGYPEMSFFKSNLFLPNIMPAYQTMFADIVLYNDTRDGDVNYEYLFNLTNSTGGDEPEPSSLFNVDTLKQLISLGQNTKDIVNDTSGNADLNLDSWTELTTTLGLADNRQTYMSRLGCWPLKQEYQCRTHWGSCKQNFPSSSMLTSTGMFTLRPCPTASTYTHPMVFRIHIK